MFGFLPSLESAVGYGPERLVDTETLSLGDEAIMVGVEATAQLLVLARCERTALGFCNPVYFSFRTKKCLRTFVALILPDPHDQNGSGSENRTMMSVKEAGVGA